MILSIDRPRYYYARRCKVILRREGLKKPHHLSLLFTSSLFSKNMNQTLPFSRGQSRHWPVHLSATPISEDTEIQCTKFMTSAITFKTTDVFVHKLERLTRSHIFDEQEWSAFITFCIRAWICCIIFAAFLMYVLFYDK